jgi:hypothetical protein
VPRLLKSLVVVSLTPVVLALPVVGRSLPRPHAVAPHVAEHAVGGVDRMAARSVAGWGAPGPATARPLAITAAVPSETFSALGVTWASEAGIGEVEAAARVRQDGRWTAWHLLDADDDHGPDAGELAAAGVRGGTSPWFTGLSDGYQVRVGVRDGRAPRDVRVSLVDPGTSAADGSIGASPTLGSASADAAPARPTIVTRAQWGADESLRSSKPSYSDRILTGFVHHTDTSNSYTSSQAAAMVRSVYAFHVRSRGWSDIGYNFLVDKYGRVFEGRYGGADRPVIGAHTGGFNTDTFGVALLGTYTSVVPSSAELASVQRVFAWKFSLHYVNPLGTTVLTSRGGTKYAPGTRVRFNNVSGHRDAGLTSCPGNQTYSRLPSIRAGIKARMGASLYYPSVTNTVPLFLTSPNPVVRAGVPSTQSWRLNVRNARTGALVRTTTGTGGTGINAVWDLRDATGKPVVPDAYTLELQSWNASSTARPYVVRVDVRSPLPSGVVLAGSDGVPFGIVDNGRLSGIAPALAKALRPGAVTAYPGPVAALWAAQAPPRDGMYVRNAAGTATWLVVDGARRPVTSAVATALGLPAARVLSDDVLRLVPQGPSWAATARHPDGTVVTTSDTAWRIESGVRRAFTSMASRNAWSKGVAVAPARDGDLALPLGAPLAPPEGIVVRETSGTAYVVSGGAWRPVTAALGYAVTTAPIATAGDLAALPLGEPATAHPSGSLLRNGTAYAEVLGTTKRPVDAALVALDPRPVLTPLSGELASLGGARWVTPSGIAGRALDGTVRVVADGRLVTLSPQAAHALGYDAATLPALEAADFGPLPVSSSLANPDAHPAGTLVTDGTATWLLDGSSRRPVAASLVAAFLGRPALPATAADLALPVSGNAGPPTGAWLRTADGAKWLVDGSARRLVSSAVAHRLGLDAVPPIDVVLADLTSSTVLGPAVA